MESGHWSGSVKGELGGKDKKPEKKIHEVRTRKGKSGGYIHEHHHTHPEHHPMEEHVSSNQDEMMQHMLANMGNTPTGEGDASQAQAADSSAASAAPVQAAAGQPQIA